MAYVVKFFRDTFSSSAPNRSKTITVVELKKASVYPKLPVHEFSRLNVSDYQHSDQVLLKCKNIMKTLIQYYCTVPLGHSVHTMLLHDLKSTNSEVFHLNDTVDKLSEILGRVVYLSLLLQACLSILHCIVSITFFVSFLMLNSF